MSQQKVEHNTCPLSSTCSSSPSSGRSSQQSNRKRSRILDINAQLTCVLCGGYFIDATTIIECLHSFCKSCIVKYLETNKCCPICDVQVHKTKPLINIRSDKTLQDIVYKMAPDVFKNEMQRRRDFYTNHTEAAEKTTSEDRGEIPEHRMFYMPHDKISLSLEYGYGDNQIPENGYCTAPVNQQTTEKSNDTETKRRYLLCPAGLSVYHLKKFIVTKYGLPNTFQVDIMYLEDILSEDYTLMDVAYIYEWRRSDPMRLFYRISERPVKRQKTMHSLAKTIESNSGSVNSTQPSNNNSNSLSHSKMGPSTTTSTSKSIMTGAATMNSANTVNNCNSNSKTPSVTSNNRPSVSETPKNTDTKRSAYRVASSTASASTSTPPPQGISSKAEANASGALQTDEPPKKLRRILPAKSTTPKAVASAQSTSSTVTTLRQCRINSDKNKSVYISARETSQEQFHVTPLGINDYRKTTKSDKSATIGTSSTTKHTPLVSSVTSSSSLASASSSSASASGSAQSASQRKSSSNSAKSFDVRTLIGTKSPPHSSHQNSGSETVGSRSIASRNVNVNETGINSRSIVTTKGITIVRDVNRNSVSSSTASQQHNTHHTSTGTFGNKKPAVPASHALPRPQSPLSPPHRQMSNSGAKDLKKTNTFGEKSHSLKSSKSEGCDSQKHLNSKSIKGANNSNSNGNVNNSNDNNEASHNSQYHKNTIAKVANKPIPSHGANSRTTACAPQTHRTTPEHRHRQSQPLSPPSIHIKLPPPPQPAIKSQSESTCKSEVTAQCEHKQLTVTPSKAQSLKELSASQENGTKQTKQASAAPQTLQENQSAHSQQQQQGSIHRSTLSKPTLSSSTTKMTQPKGASINQIVSKIASAKSVSVNVTSTTTCLELPKTSPDTNGSTSSALKVNANDVNDDKVSTTTNESGVSSSVQQYKNNNTDDCAIKSVNTSPNTGNLVIRISTKAVVENKSDKNTEKSSSEKFTIFEIKRNNSNDSNQQSAATGTPNSNKVNSSSDIDTIKSDKNLTVSKSENTSDDEDEDDDDTPLGGRKLVVVVPNEDSCELVGDNDVNVITGKVVSCENDDIDSGRGSDVARLSCDETDIGSPQSTTLSIKTPDSLGTPSDISSSNSKLPTGVSSTFSSVSGILASPPPTPSPKSDGDNHCCSTVANCRSVSASTSSSSFNIPLDLSTNKKDSITNIGSSSVSIISPHSPSCIRAIYDIPPSKPKQCVNPAVLDKHRVVFPPSYNLNKQHQSFKILPPQPSRHPNPSPQSFSTTNSGKKSDRSMSSAPNASPANNINSHPNNSHSSRNHHRDHHHHHHNYQNKNYSVITDPHRDPKHYAPKIVIKNIGSPPSMSSHLHYNH